MFSNKQFFNKKYQVIYSPNTVPAIMIVSPIKNDIITSRIKCQQKTKT